MSDVPWGAFLPELDAAAIAGLMQAARSRPRWIHRFVALGEPVPDAEWSLIRDSGAMPMVSIEPWRPGDGVTQPDYALRRIADGDHDDDLDRWGTAFATFGSSVLMRFAHEMNGDWYPWAVGVNGNSAEDYRDAWSHMRSRIRAAGADEVEFVWAPNIVAGGVADFEDAYPGNDVVDVIGIDGYNWGDIDGHRWTEPGDVFGSSLARLGEVTGGGSVLITEVGCADDVDQDRKAQWLNQFAEFVDDDDIAGFVWFQVDKERDWRFDSSLESEKAFRSVVDR